MSLVHTQWCFVCQYRTQHIDNRCVACKKRLEAQIKIYEETKRNVRKRMTLEERVAELERRVNWLTTRNK